MKDTGGPAFPQQDDATGSAGMTLRDYFAAKAMQGRAATHAFSGTTNESAARWAYAMADAMLKERNNGKA